MSTTTTTTTTTTRDRRNCYGPMEWAQLSVIGLRLIQHSWMHCSMSTVFYNGYGLISLSTACDTTSMNARMRILQKVVACMRSYRPFQQYFPTVTLNFHLWPWPLNFADTVSQLKWGQTSNPFKYNNRNKIGANCLIFLFNVNVGYMFQENISLVYEILKFKNNQFESQVASTGRLLRKYYSQWGIRPIQSHS